MAKSVWEQRGNLIFLRHRFDFFSVFPLCPVTDSFVAHPHGKNKFSIFFLLFIPLVLMLSMRSIWINLMLDTIRINMTSQPTTDENSFNRLCFLSRKCPQGYRKEWEVKKLLPHFKQNFLCLRHSLEEQKQHKIFDKSDIFVLMSRFVSRLVTRILTRKGRTYIDGRRREKYWKNHNSRRRIRTRHRSDVWARRKLVFTSRRTFRPHLSVYSDEKHNFTFITGGMLNLN